MSSESKQESSRSSPQFTVRPAVLSDCAAIHRLIIELAIYEKEPNEVANTVKQLEIDGFGPEPRYFAFVAETNEPKSVIGFALNYFAYSTWKGTCVYMEDLYVQHDYRKLGIGLALIHAVIEFAHKNNYARVMFQALNWNTNAIDFYKSLGAVDMADWLPIRFTRDKIEQFIQNAKPNPNIQLLTQ
jgi:GNAT superfamily N-acetyltransferase